MIMLAKSTPPPHPLIVSLAVNHHSTGQFTGLCKRVNVCDGREGIILSLESPWLDRHLRCEIGPTHVRLGQQRTWPHWHHAPYFGNWCWDAVLMDPSDAADLVNFCVSKRYTPMEAMVEVWDAIEAGQPVTAGILMGVGL